MINMAERLAYDASGREISFNSKYTFYRAEGAVACEILEQLSSPNSMVSQTYRKLLADMDKEMPRATSGAVLIARMDW